jgi:hypothetical protein
VQGTCGENGKETKSAETSVLFDRQWVFGGSKENETIQNKYGTMQRKGSKILTQNACSL